MASNYYIVLSVGLLAQLFFASRQFVQWIQSEKAHEVLSPGIFWQLSLVASFLLCIYGWLRNDFPIILGQLISYYIYIWNLQTKGLWKKIPGMLRLSFMTVPVVALIYLGSQGNATLTHLFRQANIPLWLIVFGITGQLIFSLRFIFQWWHSRKAGRSIFPRSFWLISIAGALVILYYAVIRRDMVLILGQLSGLVIYTRNLMISYTSVRKNLA